jgi:peptidoglycan/xylan/chitin deacetylase (PgdA/CDA1 family)
MRKVMGSKVRPFLVSTTLGTLSCLLACAQSPSVASDTAAAPLQGNSALDGSDLPDRVLSLTFDDGPGAKTVELATYLHDERIQATFFVIGNNARGKEAVLAQLRALGHLVGNHTYTHTPIVESEDPALEISRTDALIAPHVTGNMFLFRAPQGKWNQGTADRLRLAGLDRYVGHVHWTAGGTFSQRTSMDWNCWQQGASVAECGRGYLTEISDVRRGVVLMHDIHDRTLELVRWAVPRLRARGFAFARLDASKAIAAALRKASARPTAIAPVPSRPTPPRTFLSSTPFDLSFLAYRGELREEGIPAGGSLCDGMASGGLDARVVADAAAYSGWLALSEATDGSYLNALELQLHSLCN